MRTTPMGTSSSKRDLGRIRTPTREGSWMRRQDCITSGPGTMIREVGDSCRRIRSVLEAASTSTPSWEIIQLGLKIHLDEVAVQINAERKQTKHIINVLPIWLKLAVMFSSKNIDESFSLLFFIMGGLLIPVAGGLKHYRPKLKIIDRALLAAGLLIEVVFLVKLFKPALSHVAVALPLSISLAVSTWWTVVY